MMEAIREKSPGYPTQIVPSGTRYAEFETSNRTEVYEFQSTEPYDPRNCRISLPPITEEVFGVEESAASYSITASSHVRSMSLAYSIQVETSNLETDEESNNSIKPTKL